MKPDAGGLGKTFEVPTIGLREVSLPPQCVLATPHAETCGPWGVSTTEPTFSMPQVDCTPHRLPEPNINQSEEKRHIYFRPKDPETPKSKNP